jgi:Tfp pilus assembly protein PilN
MRPVNLIPPEERRGATAPMRTGALPYLLIGVLVLALAGVTLLVLASNKVSDGKAEVAKLTREDAAAQARAEELAPFVQFQITQEERAQTIASLADSRFDWERVMRELSLILPHDAWLVSLNASASPNATEGGEGGASGGGLRASVPGPALEMEGCAAGQEAVAGFVTDLKDIDAVTRVGVESSARPEEASASSSAGSGEAAAEGANEECRTRDFIAKFKIVVAFDAAPVPESATAAPVATEPAPEGESESESSEEG